MNIIFHSRKILVTLTLFILLITLYFGLRFKVFGLENHVTLLHDQPGIHFQRFGVAYAKIDTPDKSSSLKNFTIEIALKTDSIINHTVDPIMTIHDGKDSDQLIIYQWLSRVMIMNGDDFSSKGKIKRISADIFDSAIKKMMLTVVTGNNGTELFIDGELIKSSPDLILKVPVVDKPILIFGNSVYGKNQWQGDVYGFTLYDHRLPYETIEKHFKNWKESKDFSGFNEEKPLVLFDFKKKDENGISGLTIPNYFPVFKKEFLPVPWKSLRLNVSSLSDMIINLIGFIPLGFILYALVSNIWNLPQRRMMMITVLACFLLSLFIEITQAWIPSRTSQSLDLILNTAGGFIGGRMALSAFRKWASGTDTVIMSSR